MFAKGNDRSYIASEIVPSTMHDACRANVWSIVNLFSPMIRRDFHYGRLFTYYSQRQRVSTPTSHSTRNHPPKRVRSVQLMSFFGGFSFTLTCGRSRFVYSSAVRSWIHALGCRENPQLNYDKDSVNDCLDASLLQLTLYSHCHSHRQVGSVSKFG